MARADDATALMHNPAGLAKITNYEIFVGANLVHFKQTFDRSGVYQEWVPAGPEGPAEPGFAGAEMPEVESDNPIQPIPMLAGGARVIPNFTIGLGLFAPQGYPNRDFPTTITVNGMETEATPNRYDITKEETLAAFPSIAAAYRILPNLDVGARFSAGFSMLKSTNSLWGAVNNNEDVEADGLFESDVKDNFVPAFGFGVLYRPLPYLELGASYASKAELKMKGKGKATLGSRLDVGDVPSTVGPVEDEFARCGTGGKVNDLKACINVAIPQTATIGARFIFRGSDGQEVGDVELDYRWEDHSASDRITVIVDGQIDNTQRPLEEVVLKHGFKDVHSVRLGGSYNLPVGHSILQLRGGAAYDTAAAPVSWTRLDIDGTERTQFALGVSYQAKSWKVDLGGAMILSQARDVTGEDPFDPRFDDGPPGCMTEECADNIDVPERDQPDATNPVVRENAQPFQPINQGHYESGYIIVATGFTYMW